MIRVLKITALVSAVVLFNAVTTLLFFQSAAPVSAGPNCVNGDVNGDFVVDITDPIHLLSYIFEGSPVPVACAQNPPLVPHFRLSGAPNIFLNPGPTSCGASFGAPPCEPYLVSFSTDQFDSGVLATPLGPITIQESGVYHLHFELSTQIPGSHNASLQIRRNGQVIADSLIDLNYSGQREGRSLSTLDDFQEGDVVEFWFVINAINSGGVYQLHSDRTFAFGYKVSD